MLTVFPLIAYILRVQLCYAVTKKEPTASRTIIINMMIVAICASFAIWLPKIGTIIRFTGAFCGIVYLFVLPIGLYLKWQLNQGTLGVLTTILHIFLLCLGVLNFILQFSV